MDMKEVNYRTLVSLIRDFERDRGVTVALAEAVRYSLIDEVTRLIENGADVNARTEYGCSPLMYAGNRKVAKLLLEHGAEVNARDPEGRTPLICFLMMLETPAKAEAYVKFLLKAGANPDVVDDNGRTAYELAKEKYGPRVANLLVPPEDKATGGTSRSG